MNRVYNKRHFTVRGENITYYVSLEAIKAFDESPAGSYRQMELADFVISGFGTVLKARVGVEQVFDTYCNLSTELTDEEFMRRIKS